MIVLARGRFGSAPARVLEQVRRSGPVTREELARVTGLSPATVARTIGTLVEEQLVRERPDLLPGGTVGRPSAPVDLDPDHHATLGVHVGRRLTTVGLVDLAGNLVSQTRGATPEAGAEAIVSAAVRGATQLLAANPERSVLSAGLVAAWGDVDLDEADLGARLAAATGFEVSTAHHVAAVVAAEYMAKRRDADGCTAYVYVRDTAGFALANDVPDRTEVSRVAALTHFPTRSPLLCRCGRTGCFEAVASDHALARRAFEAGVVARPEIEALHAAARGGDVAAHTLLCERARVLGETAAVVRDMVAPDRVVLVGQAFTGYPPALDEVATAFADATTLPPIELSFTRFGTGVQAVAAGTVALGPVYEDPLGSVGRTVGTTVGSSSRRVPADPAPRSVAGPVPAPVS
jgi:predicted NBD/HSP70 family sugar kinase